MWGDSESASKNTSYAIHRIPKYGFLILSLAYDLVLAYSEGDARRLDADGIRLPFSLGEKRGSYRGSPQQFTTAPRALTGDARLEFLRVRLRDALRLKMKSVSIERAGQ